MALINSAIGVATKRMPKAITPKGHAVIDYITLGAFIVTGALYWRRHKRAALSAFICGGAELALSLLTDYPGGVKKVISFPTHCKVDIGLAAMTAAMPEVMGFKDDREKRFFLAQSAGITVATNLTDVSGTREFEDRSLRAA
jgi:hypothetical protein